MTSGQELIHRLREEVQNALSQRSSSMEAELQGLQETLLARLGDVRQKLQEPPTPELPIEGTIAGVLEEAGRVQKQLAAEPGRRMTELSELTASLRCRETQAEVLDCLLDGAVRFAPATALLLVRAEGFTLWAARGLSDEDAARLESEPEFPECPLLIATVESGFATADTEDSLPPGSLLGPDAVLPWHAVALRAMEKTVAVLVTAASATRECDPGALRVLAEVAGLSLENMALRVLQEVKAGDVAAEEPEAAPEVESPVATAPAAPEPVQAAGAAATGFPAEAEPPAPEPVIVEPAVEAVPAAVVESGSQVEPAPSIPAEPPAEQEPPVAEVATQPVAAVLEPEPAAAPAPEAEPAAESEPVSPAPDTVSMDIDRELESIRQAIRSFEARPAQDEPPPPAEPEPVLQEVSVPEPVAVEPAVLEPVAVQAPEPEVIQTPEPPPSAPQWPVLVTVAQSPPPVVLPSPTPIPPPPPPAPPMSAEEKLHADAKRFARLLVSEIKLYNEQRVLEGRQNRDIYVRLKRDIDRSRDVYEKRVDPTVARRIDYFHDEIVRILGDNDVRMLGSDYPGPRVES